MDTNKKIYIRKYKGLDLYAFFIEKKIVYADTVYHIVELREDGDRGLDITNLFPLSNSNHNVIYAMYDMDNKSTQKLLKDLLKRWRMEYEW